MQIKRKLKSLLLMAAMCVGCGAQAQNVLILTTGGLNAGGDAENNYLPKVIQEFSRFTDPNIAPPTACAPTTASGIDPTTGKTKVVTCDQFSLVNKRLSPARPAMTADIFAPGYDLLVIASAYTTYDDEAWTVIADAIATRKVRGVVAMVDTASPANAAHIQTILNDALAKPGIPLSPQIIPGPDHGSSTYYHPLNTNATVATYFQDLTSIGLDYAYKSYLNVPSANALYVEPESPAPTGSVTITTPTVSAPVTFITHAQSHDGLGACFFGATDVGWVNVTSAWDNNTPKLSSAFYKAFDATAAENGPCALPIASPPTLSISKSTTADTRHLPANGANVPYTITVTNTSAAALALNVGVSDTPPAGLSFPNTWSCTSAAAPSGGIAPTCPTTLTDPAATDGGLKTSIARLASGASMTFTTTAVVVDNQRSLVNVAVLAPPAGATCDGTGTDPCTATVSLAPPATVQITKSTNVPVTTAPLDTSALTYTVTVTNQSTTTDVLGATLTDAEPAGIGFSGGWTCTANTTAVPTASCPTTLPTSGGLNGLALPDLPAGAVLTFTASAQVTNNQAALKNVAVLSLPAGNHCANGQCQAEVDFLAPSAPTVSIAKTTTVSNTVAPVNGSTVPYVVTVSNLSAVTRASNLQLSDAVPAGMGFGAWSCSVKTPGTPNTVCPAGLPTSGSLNGFVIPVLTTGAVLEFTVTATVNDNKQSLNNTATLTPSSGVLCADGATSCSATVTFPAAPAAVVQVLKSTTADTSRLPAKGASVPYAVRVTNQSTVSSTAGVQLADPQPAGLEFGAWSCSVIQPGTPATATCPTGLPASGSLNTSIANLPAGAVLEFAVTAKVTDATADLTNTATLSLPADAQCAGGVQPCEAVVKFEKKTDSGSTVAVPTLGEWALIALSSMLAMLGLIGMRRRHN